MIFFYFVHFSTSKHSSPLNSQLAKLVIYFFLVLLIPTSTPHTPKTSTNPSFPTDPYSAPARRVTLVPSKHRHGAVYHVQSVVLDKRSKQHYMVNEISALGIPPGSGRYQSLGLKSHLPCNIIYV